jgi:hypothetical protein
MVYYIYLALAVIAIIGISTGVAGILLIRKGRRAAEGLRLDSLVQEAVPGTVAEESRSRPRKSD